MNGNWRPKGLSLFLTAVLLGSLSAGLLVVLPVGAHIPEGQGDPLQLFSLFDGDAATKINMFDGGPDAGIARVTGNYDEWDGASVRNITLTNGAGDSRFAYLFFANDDDFLWIGLVYPNPNSASSNSVTHLLASGSSELL